MNRSINHTNEVGVKTAFIVEDSDVVVDDEEDEEEEEGAADNKGDICVACADVRVASSWNPSAASINWPRPGKNKRRCSSKGNIAESTWTHTNIKDDQNKNKTKTNNNNNKLKT